MSDNKQELQKQAEELGVKVDSRWGEDRLSTEIDKALAAEPDREDEQDETSSEQGGEKSSESLAETSADQEPPKQKTKSRRSKPDTYKNTTNGVVYIAGHRVRSGASHELTDIDKKNAIGMKRLEHAVKLGMVEKV